jgi:dolichyl-phosphate-mannose--protein O-mannosyl transferase
MTETPPPIASLSEEGLQVLLQRCIRNTLILGGLSALALLIGSGWRNAAMMATGALISAASILEWQRLTRLINARMRQQKAQRGAALVIGFFLFRLIFFAAAIYGSLKCFHGSPIALVCGLSLAVATLMWEAIRMLRD